MINTTHLRSLLREYETANREAHAALRSDDGGHIRAAERLEKATRNLTAALFAAVPELIAAAESLQAARSLAVAAHNVSARQPAAHATTQKEADDWAAFYAAIEALNVTFPLARLP